MNWELVEKPAAIAEKRLLEGILTNHFPVNCTLPGERELAVQIGVTRPTLREALQRLGRDGWLDIQQGKPTRVRDYWREGSLAVLSVLAQQPSRSTTEFVVHLLDLRALIAPAYTRQAVNSASAQLFHFLDKYTRLDENPQIYSEADWELHQQLTQWSTNPVFCLLLNGFKQLYAQMGEWYFAYSECRQHSRKFYIELKDCARRNADQDAEDLTRRVMMESVHLWRKNSLHSQSPEEPGSWDGSHHGEEFTGPDKER